MFKLVVLISLGVSWIGLCIEGTGNIDDESKLTKTVFIEPIDTVHEDTRDEDVKREKRGKNEPTLALLLTYHGNNCHKKQKAATSKFETIHITNGGSAKNVPMNNAVGKKLLESIVHTTSPSSSSADDSIRKNPGEHAIQHKYQELLDQLNSHPGHDKCGCCGLNRGSCKNRNQQYVQLTGQSEPLQAIEKHTSILESVGSKSSGSLVEDHHQHRRHHHHDHASQHNDDDTPDDITSSSHEDESISGSYSTSDESDEFDASFEVSRELSASDQHEHIGPVEHSHKSNTHDNYRQSEFHPRQPIIKHTITPKPEKLRPTLSSKPHTDHISHSTKSQKSQSRILTGPHIKLKSKHFPHNSHLKPLYIETESIYSDSMESDESQSYDLYSDEESFELPIETDNHGHKYKSGNVIMK